MELKKIIILTGVFFLSLKSFTQIKDTIYISDAYITTLIFKNKNLRFKINEELVFPEHSDNYLFLRPFEIKGKPFTTNLFVEDGGKYYQFIVVNSEKPPSKVYNYSITDSLLPGVQINGTKSVEIAKNQAEIKAEEDYYKSRFETISKKKSNINNVVQYKYGYQSSIRKMFIDNDKIFIEYTIKNTTNIAYDMKWYKVFWGVRKGIFKRRVQNEEVQDVIRTYQEIKRVEGKEERSMILVFDKFTLDKKKNLYFEATEREGDRIILLKCSQKILNNIEKL